MGEPEPRFRCEEHGPSKGFWVVTASLGGPNAVLPLYQARKPSTEQIRRWLNEFGWGEYWPGAVCVQINGPYNARPGTGEEDDWYQLKQTPGRYSSWFETGHDS